MDAREIPESIQWHEGLLLTPQHFQQHALRHEALLQYVSTATMPFNWGVRYFKVDPSSLAGGIFRVIELEALMPDGLVVSCGLRRGEELRVDLKPYKAHPVTVHLAVAARETDAITRGDLARYDSVEGDPVPDENTGEGAVRIPRLRPRLTLLVDDTPPRKYVTLPLARVTYRDESYASTDFIPPVLAVERQSPLGVLCSSAARRLREKAQQLDNQLRSPASGSRLGVALETEGLIRSLVAPLPLLECVLKTGVSHPYLVYLTLCTVAGHVSVMGRSLVPPEFAPYDHNDLRASFEQVLSYIFRKIDEGINSSHTVHPFTDDGVLYSLQFDGEWAGKRLAIGIRGTAGMTEQDVARWGQECLIGSRRLLRAMRENRVRGARRTRIERDEEIAPPRGIILFELKADPEFVEPDEVLQIFNTSERGQSQRPAEIVLYVKDVPRDVRAAPGEAG
jgi:type VI secretion system protein ImpJ